MNLSAQHIAPDIASAMLEHDAHWLMDMRRGVRMVGAVTADASEMARLTAVWSRAQRDRAAGMLHAAMPNLGTSPSAQEKPYLVVGRQAVLFILGPMTKRGSWWWYGTSTVETRELLAKAEADSDIDGILFVIDSPGGQVAGTADLGNDIAACSKPTVAFIEDCGCSAAYWIACQCGQVYINQTGMTPNIGTVMIVVDYSKYYAEMGFEVLMFSTGPYKGAGSPGTKITEEQRADFQREVDDINEHFLAAVTSGRKMDAAKVKELADGRVYIGRDAVKLGFVDAVATLPAVISAMEEGRAIDCDDDDDDDDDDGDEDDDDIDSKRVARRANLTRPKNSRTPPNGGSGITATSPNNQPANAGKGAQNMKEKLFRALRALRLTKMAYAVEESKDESVEALAAVMAGEVNEQVQELVAIHPLIVACGKAGINSADDLTPVLAMKALGERALTERRAEAKAAAIRASAKNKNQELGVLIGAQVDHLNFDAATALRDAWESEAAAVEESLGVGKDGSAATRQSAPAARMAIPAEEGATDTRSAYEQLDAEQKSIVDRMANTTEKREAMAKQFLTSKAA